jgi:drug/metabolite transporter (DMT)-like permease
MAISRSKSAVLELAFAGALWGFGFIAAVWALRSMGPMAITGWRFTVAAVIGFTIVGLRPSLRSHLTREQFWLACVPGMLICATLVFQTWGLRYTTATKSSFITTLYVLIVPVLERLWLKRHVPRMHYLFVIIALIGVALICDLAGEFTGGINGTDPRLRWNFGDLLTLICSFAASVHIIWFGRINQKIGDSFVFNNFQSLWACAIPLVASFALEPAPTPNLSDLSMIGFLMLAIGSTLIAFALQVRAQKVISPSLASLLFLLESPFATLFAIYFLGESLRTGQWVGAGLILAAAGLSTVFAAEVENER